MLALFPAPGSALAVVLGNYGRWHGDGPQHGGNVSTATSIFQHGAMMVAAAGAPVATEAC